MEIAKYVASCLAIDRFDSSSQEQLIQYAQCAIPGDEAKQLFSFEDVDSVLDSPAVDVADVDLIVAGKLRQTRELMDPAGGVDPLRTLAGYQQGGTIRLRNLQHYLPKVAELSRAIAGNIHAQVGVNAYATPSNQEGYEPHFDDQNLIVIQCHGKKLWRIYENYSNQVPLPRRGTGYRSVDQAPGLVEREVELSPGDVLFVPRGVLHGARAREHSLHLTLAYHPLTWAELLHRALDHAIQADVELRRSVPFGGALTAEELHTVGSFATEAIRSEQLYQALQDYLEGYPHFIPRVPAAAFAEFIAAEQQQETH